MEHTPSRLNISAADNQPYQLVIKWSQQFTHRLEPAAQCAFGKTDTQMAELLDLPVEWDVIFVFLQEHFGQHGGTGQTFVNRRRWKRSNDYTAFTFLGKTQVVFQSIFGTDSLLYIQPSFLLAFNLFSLPFGLSLIPSTIMTRSRHSIG